MATFVDSNVFVRLFTEDEPEKMKQAAALFKRAENNYIDLVVGPPVLFEVAWTLASTYKIPRGKILDVLEVIISFPNLKTLDKELVIAAISLARETGCEFADAYIAATAQSVKVDDVATFNKKHFKKLGVDLYSFNLYTH